MNLEPESRTNRIKYEFPCGSIRDELVKILIPKSDVNYTIRNTLAFTDRGNELVWEGNTQRVMRVYSKWYTKQGDFVFMFYELPNVSSRSYYNVWRSLCEGVTDVNYRYLKWCTSEWWNQLHFDGQRQEDKNKQLRDSYNLRQFEGHVSRKLYTSSAINLPKHLTSNSSRKQISFD